MQVVDKTICSTFLTCPMYTCLLNNYTIVMYSFFNVFKIIKSYLLSYNLLIFSANKNPIGYKL